MQWLTQWSYHLYALPTDIVRDHLSSFLKFRIEIPFVRYYNVIILYILNYVLILNYYNVNNILKLYFMKIIYSLFKDTGFSTSLCVYIHVCGYVHMHVGTQVKTEEGISFPRT